MTIKKRDRKLDTIKFFAILSIICAHVSPVTNNNTIYQKISLLLDSLGCLGVGVFFLISGYLFYQNKETFTEFMKKKVTQIIVPWVFVGTIVYVSVFYFQNNLSFINYINFLVGNGSYLYYLTVLMILYIIYFKLRENKKFIYISTILSIFSIILTIVFGYNQFSYLNIFNWMLYFNLGVILNKWKLYSKFCKTCSRTFKINTILLLCIFGFSLVTNKAIGYWSWHGPVTIFINIMVLFGINLQSISKNSHLNMLIEYIGTNSLAFYLVHMSIAGVIVRITNYANSIVLIAIRPLIVLVITLFVIYVYDIMIKKMKIKKLNVLIGIR